MVSIHVAGGHAQGMHNLPVQALWRDKSLICYANHQVGGSVEVQNDAKFFIRANTPELPCRYVSDG